LTNSGKVYFGLYGDNFEPDEITEMIGLEPTSTNSKGDPLPKKHSWKFGLDEIEADYIDIYEMSSELVSKLKPVSSKIVEAKEKFNLELVLQVVLWISTDETISTPAIGFESDVIDFLDKVGATIDIDTYLTES
jgi:hypothetical protein